jgi:hypothetical protein
VPDLLRLFTTHNIRATWAAVGAIGCRTWDEYFLRAPPAPAYERPHFAIQRRYADLDPDGRLHFAPHLMQMIVSAPGQELGTHTFSHIYYREGGITARDVAADLAAVRQLYQERFGVIPQSLVFPRNQSGFEDVLREASIMIWRGNPDAWYYERENSRDHTALPRMLKLLDALNPYSRRAAPLEPNMTRASVFLRLNLPPLLWASHFARIKRELALLGPNEVLHLWFHPHNLGADTSARLARLEQILDLIGERLARGTVTSCRMADLVASPRAPYFSPSD